MLARRQNAAEPYLFDEEQMPLRPDVVDLVQQGNHRHTGARLLENEKLCLRLVELLMAKWGIKRIGRELGVSKWTVKAARDALVARGEMAPWKERVVGIFNDIIESGAQVYRDGIEDGKVPPAQIPVGMGIVWDKRALAVGEPTSIDLAARVQVDAKALTVERIKAAILAISEDHSDGKLQIAAKCGGEAVSGASFGANSGPDMVEAGAEGGGGGSEVSGGAEVPMQSVERTTTQKDSR